MDWQESRGSTAEAMSRLGEAVSEVASPGGHWPAGLWPGGEGVGIKAPPVVVECQIQPPGSLPSTRCGHSQSYPGSASSQAKF